MHTLRHIHMNIEINTIYMYILHWPYSTYSKAQGAS